MTTGATAPGGAAGAGGGPAGAEVRRAVRAALAGLPDRTRRVPLLVACSGGADSLALAAAAVALRGADGVRGAVVDHGLQDGSADQARSAVEILAGLGIGATVHRVAVGGGGGPEAAARRARYDALRAARPHPDSAVLLGHTLDDQAETVLLGLGRGSGARSLAGMRGWDAPWLRPLLGVRRATTRAACAELGLPVWDDPHNADPRFTRVRLRHEVLPLLEDVLSGGVAAALARTATQLREDVDALDVVAGRLLDTARDPAADPACETVGNPARNAVGDPARDPAGDRTRDPAADPGRDPARVEAEKFDALRVEPLHGTSPALRRRVLRAWLTAAGVTGLTEAHLRSADVLAAHGPDRGGPALPGGLELIRSRGRLSLRPVGWPPAVTTGPDSTTAPPRARRHPTVYDGDIASTLVTEQAIRAKTLELAAQIAGDYPRDGHGGGEKDLLLVGVLKGAVMFMTDLARALPVPVQLEFMAVSSYGSSTSSSGVVRILKDLDRDISGRHVLIVEDIIDSGLTLSWLLKNLESRQPASLQVCALLRKPDAVKVEVPVRYVGFDIPNEFVVGYGLDYAERYRDLPFIGTLDPSVYA